MVKQEKKVNKILLNIGVLLLGASSGILITLLSLPSYTEAQIKKAKENNNEVKENWQYAKKNILNQDISNQDIMLSNNNLILLKLLKENKNEEAIYLLKSQLSNQKNKLTLQQRLSPSLTKGQKEMLEDINEVLSP